MIHEANAQTEGMTQQRPFGPPSSGVVAIRASGTPQASEVISNHVKMLLTMILATPSNLEAALVPLLELVLQHMGIPLHLPTEAGTVVTDSISVANAKDVDLSLASLPRHLNLLDDLLSLLLHSPPSLTHYL